MALNFLKIRNGLTLKPNSIPTNPEAGDVYYDTTLGAFQFYQNGNWVAFNNVVTNVYGPATSTAGQTTINISPIIVASSAISNLFLYVDGKLLSYGSGADYTLTFSGGFSSTVVLNQSLAANLNIQAYYFGSSQTSNPATAPTVQKFLAGSGTYTTPINPAPLYIQVEMAGGGGGGAGSGAGGGGGGGAGGNTTFGSSLLAANGGGGASGGIAPGGAGGSASLGTGPIGVVFTGGQGGAGGSTTSFVPYMVGGSGGTTSFGGGGSGGVTGGTGGAGAANTGAGGGGGGGNGGTTNQNMGAGGGSGGYVKAIISSPAATYTYSVGTAGTAGAAGGSGFAGGAGGIGVIIVTEYYAASGGSGTTFTAQTANTVFAGPTTGSSAQPAFRALVAADLPSGFGQAAVSNTYGPVASTAGQTTITLPFTVPTLNVANFILYVNGVILSQGSSNDYTFSSTTTITLNKALAAGLNINAVYFGTVTPLTATIGVKNYLSAFGNFETGTVSGFSLFNTTLTSGIPTGTITAGAASLSTPALISSGQLAGNYSMSIASPGAITAGQGFIAQSITIDIEDRAKVLTGKFYYSVISGLANLNLSGTSANTWAVYLYDTANSVWIQPAGTYGMTQGTGAGFQTFTFQTASNATSYQVALICVNASAGASTIYFDDFALGPQTTPLGAAITDWTPFTPTMTGLTGGSQTYAAHYRRVGDSIDLEIQVSFGSAPSGSIPTFTLPNGWNIDVTKMTSTNNANIGTATVGGSFVGTVQFISSTSIAVNFLSVASTNISWGSITPTVPTTLSGSTLTVRVFNLPIVGWSSNVQMSNDTDTRVVAATIGLTTTQALTVSGVIKYDTVVFDDAGSYSTSTGLYTCPISGKYEIQVTGQTSASANFYLGVNGVGKAVICGLPNSGNVGSGSYTVKCNAGDTLGIYSANSSINAVGTGTFGFSNAISIIRVSGPAVIAATESVNASYNSTSGTVVGSSFTVLPFGNKYYDSHNAWNTVNANAYTAPVSGKYRLSATIIVGGGTIATSQIVDLIAVQSGSASVTKYLNYVPGNGSAGASYGVAGSATFNMLAGDTLQLQSATNGTGTNTLATSAGNCHFDIERVGN